MNHLFASGGQRIQALLTVFFKILSTKYTKYLRDTLKSYSFPWFLKTEYCGKIQIPRQRRQMQGQCIMEAERGNTVFEYHKWRMEGEEARMLSWDISGGLTHLDKPWWREESHSNSFVFSESEKLHGLFLIVHESFANSLLPEWLPLFFLKFTPILMQNSKCMFFL